MTVDVKKLFESGVHFGHKTSKWHPKMAPYIHSKRNGIHVIDLTKTAKELEEALKFIEKVASEGKQVLLVGTKKQAQDAIRETADATGMPYVVERWVGGMLTNRKTFDERLKYLNSQEQKMDSGELGNRFNKLEVQRFQEEIDEMNRIYGGIKEMHAKPGVVVVTDVLDDKNAVREAIKLGIPVVGICDTDADPTNINYPVPANDDAVKSIKTIVEYVQAAIESGKAKVKKVQPKTDEKKADDPNADKKPAVSGEGK